MDPSGFRTTFEVAGSGGLIEYDSRHASSLRSHLLQEDGTSKSFSESNMSSEDDPYYLQLREFVDAVSKGTAPTVSAYDGAMAVSISLAAIESAKTGRAVVPATP